MSFVAAAVGTALVSGVVGAVGANKAAKTQAGAENNATQAQLQMFNTINSQQAPWRQAGSNALDSIAGMSDFFNHQFNANDLNANLAPNYAFTLQQGQSAINNMATVGGGLFSGNTLKAISDYTTNTAQNAYQNAFQNYTANQSNIFNRLASIAGLGQQSNQSVASSGATLGTGAAQTMAAAGAARAGGQVGVANAIGGAANNAMSWYALPQIMNMGGGGGGAGLNTELSDPMLPYLAVTGGD